MGLLWILSFKVGNIKGQCVEEEGAARNVKEGEGGGERARAETLGMKGRGPHPLEATASRRGGSMGGLGGRSGPSVGRWRVPSPLGRLGGIERALLGGVVTRPSLV